MIHFPFFLNVLRHVKMWYIVYGHDRNSTPRGRQKMKKLLLPLAIIILVTSALILLPGCEKAEEDSTSESNRWLELLRIVPVNDNTKKAVYLNDTEYFIEMTEQYPRIPLEYAIGKAHPLTGYKYYNEKEWEQTLTFTVEDVKQSIYAGIAPSNYYEAVRADFSLEEVDNAMRTGPLNEILEIHSYQGHEYYSWGGDHEMDPSWRSNVRPWGKGHRLALVDDFLFWVTWTDGIKEMIDSYDDRIDSLADNDVYQLLAIGLEELDTVNAFFSTQSQSHTSITEWLQQYPSFNYEQPEVYQRFLESIEDTVHLEPYQAFATGAGIDEQGFYMVIVLLNPDEEVARSNATLLEQRINQTESIWRGSKWSDLVESMEIHSEGRLTMARLYGAICEYWDWFDMHSYIRYEPLLMYE